MSDIKLFRLQAGQATELQGEAADFEKPLQTLIENRALHEAPCRTAHGEEVRAFCDAGYQGSGKRSDAPDDVEWHISK